jgi:hypothetical protein
VLPVDGGGIGCGSPFSFTHLNPSSKIESNSTQRTIAMGAKELRRRKTRNCGPLTSFCLTLFSLFYSHSILL